MSFLLPEIENTDVQTTLNGKASGELARTITAYTQGREALRQWSLISKIGTDRFRTRRHGRIPFYQQPLVLRDYPDLDGIGRLSLLQSLGCVPLALRDEDGQRLVSLREARRHYALI
jgi:hypothetical protein